MLIQMALKNVFRNVTRTRITVLAVFWGVFFSMLADGVNKGLEWQIGNLLIRTETSTIKIVNRNYPLDELENPLDYPVREYEPIVGFLAARSDVKAYSPRITFHGSLSNGSDEIRAIGLGIEPEKEDKVFDRSGAISQGKYLVSGEEGVLIGSDLAGLLGLRVGDMVTVISQAAEMGTNAYDLEIKGLIQTGNPVLDSGAFWIPLQFTQDFLSMTGITDIAVNLGNDSRILPFQSEVRKAKFPDKLKVFSWRDYAKDFIELVAFRKRIINILTTMILLIAGFGIMNTMLMAMMERKREIGNLMAMGVRRNEIVRLFLIEGMMIGVLGSTVAIILSCIVVYYFQLQGIPLGGAIQNALGSTPIAGKFYAYLDPVQALFYYILGIVIAVVSTVYPAWKSAKLQPVEAIRGIGGQ